MRTQDHLFSRNKWSIAAAEQRHRLEADVSNMDENMLLNTPILELCNYLAQKYRINIPILKKDQVIIEQRAAQVAQNTFPAHATSATSPSRMVAGTIIEVTIPFDGTPECFHMQPTTFTFHPPSGDVRGNSVIIQLEGVGLVADMVRAQIQQIITEIGKNLRYLQIDANRFNGNLYSYAHTVVEQQRQKINSDPDAAAAGIKVKARTADMDSEPMSEERRTVTPVLSPPAQTNVLPSLALKDYEQILQALPTIAQTIRLSPSILKTMDDAALRAYFLIQLNARFASNSGGETFVFMGNSDLCIRAEDKNIFVAECTFWAGREQFAATLNQLLGVRKWRDVRAAIIVFQRDHPFTEMRDSLRAIIRSHSSFKRELPQLSDTTFLYGFTHHGFTHHEDRSHEFLLTVLAFDVPYPQKT